MNCREFVDFVMRYLDEELPEDVRRDFEGHMDDCPQCIPYLETYRETVRLGKQILCDPPDAPLPDDVPEELVSAIHAARRR